ASEQLQAMAEGGALDGLIEQAEGAGAASAVNPADGMLAPGAQTRITKLKTRHNSRLSVLAMVLPTNDGFVGLDSWVIPKRKGRYTLYLNAYDAGTEINDEVITGGGAPGVAGIPADPGGNSGTGASGVATMEENAKVHIHRGVIGDRDRDGGTSDLDDRVHPWLNPVAKVVVWVK
ncbi:MAG: spondin domain-containing protein, partial [Motiliproteus sp.]